MLLDLWSCLGNPLKWHFSRSYFQNWNDSASRCLNQWKNHFSRLRFLSQHFPQINWPWKKLFLIHRILWMPPPYYNLCIYGEEQSSTKRKELPSGSFPENWSNLTHYPFFPDRIIDIFFFPDLTIDIFFVHWLLRQKPMWCWLPHRKRLLLRSKEPLKCQQRHFSFCKYDTWNFLRRDIFLD